MKKNIHKDTINDILLLNYKGKECFATVSDDTTMKICSLLNYSILLEIKESNSISSI